MSVSSGDITAFASEFAAVPGATIDLYINLAKFSVNPNVWREKYDFGVILLTCHMLKLKKANDASSASGAIGAVTSEKVGDLARSYGSIASAGGSTDPSSLGITNYGQEFLRLRRSLVITPMVTR
ncbi:MAG TPA: hypothetical protein DF383_10540 [Deltaproteobacteria bacterium]|nr:hypothetical protein [Deltaproteobacteria bacterium]